MLHFLSQFLFWVFQYYRYAHLCLFACCSCFVLHIFRTYVLEFSFFFPLSSSVAPHGVVPCATTLALLFWCCSLCCFIHVVVLFTLLFFTSYHSSCVLPHVLFFSCYHSSHVAPIGLRFVHRSSHTVPLTPLLWLHFFHVVLLALLFWRYSSCAALFVL